MERYSADKDRLTGVDVPGGNVIHNGGPKVKTNDECLCFWGLEIAWGGGCPWTRLGLAPVSFIFN